MVVNDGVIEKWFERPGINDTQADNDPYGETDPDRIAAHAYLPSTITPRRCEPARLIQFNAQTDRP
jgi:hypothetical protein